MGEIPQKPRMRLKRKCLAEIFTISTIANTIGIYVVPPTGVRHTGPCMTLHLKINKAKQLKAIYQKHLWLENKTQPLYYVILAQ